MSSTSKLSDAEKQNGKRTLLIPSKEIQEMMQPVDYEDFADLVKRTIPLSPQPETVEK
jgi:hypothetical protein